MKKKHEKEELRDLLIALQMFAPKTCSAEIVQMESYYRKTYKDAPPVAIDDLAEKIGAAMRDARTDDKGSSWSSHVRTLTPES